MANDTSMKERIWSLSLSALLEGRTAALYMHPMNDLLEQNTSGAPTTSRATPSAPLRASLYILTRAIVLIAFAASILLLLSDLIATPLAHAPISAAPLLCIGAAYLAFQALSRPKLLDLCKALIVAMAFILWGIDQMLPAGWFATLLGDIVISLYVLDLGWMMLDRLKQR